VYKRVIPNGGHHALRAKKPCSARALKPEAQACPVQGPSAGPNPRCGLLLPPKRPMASTAASSTWETRTSTGAGAMRRRSPAWPCCTAASFFTVSRTAMGLTPKSRAGAPTLEGPRYHPLLPPRAALVPVRPEKHGPWAIRVIPPLALDAMALLAIPHALDTLTGWTMDRYIRHSVSLWRPEPMGHSTSLATYTKHPRRDVRKDVTCLTSPSGHITFFL
jgi:hypothetical protein